MIWVILCGSVSTLGFHPAEFVLHFTKGFMFFVLNSWDCYDVFVLHCSAISRAAAEWTIFYWFCELQKYQMFSISIELSSVVSERHLVENKCITFKNIFSTARRKINSMENIYIFFIDDWSVNFNIMTFEINFDMTASLSVSKDCIAAKQKVLHTTHSYMLCISLTFDC